MPVHDWKRVSPGIFHDFHSTWIPEIKKRLNAGILPPDYYALIEQKTGDIIPDLLALRMSKAADIEGEGGGPHSGEGSGVGGAVAVISSPPKVRQTANLEMDAYAAVARRISIRQASDGEIVALVEIVSPGNKSGRTAIRAFIEKAISAINLGYHLLVVDLFPPGNFDPNGIHGAIWEELGGDPYIAPATEPLTLAAYRAGPVKTAYVEPCAVGASLLPMPLFLTPSVYVPVPLEETYAEAFQTVPQPLRAVLEGIDPAS
jgi:hypothetical protein